MTFQDFQEQRIFHCPMEDCFFVGLTLKTWKWLFLSNIKIPNLKKNYAVFSLLLGQYFSTIDCDTNEVSEIDVLNRQEQ